MKLSDLAFYLNAPLMGEDVSFEGACTDTRQLKPNEFFFAWKGLQHDSHLLLEEAKKKGACGAIVEKFYPEVKLAQIQVQNSQEALGKVATLWKEHWQQQTKGLCFALTGSNGKTTLKGLIESICAQAGETLATEGNLNNHVGCPLTLMQLKKEHKFAVIEMGANHPNEIRYLTHITKPNIAILNNAGLCHLEGFINLEGVAKAKAEIFEGLTATDQYPATAIINSDDSFSSLWIDLIKEIPFKNHPNIWGFGINPNADVLLKSVSPSYYRQHQEELGINPKLEINHQLSANQFEIQLSARFKTFLESQQTVILPESFIITLNLLGLHNLKNALASIAASLAGYLSITVIQKGIQSFETVKGRLQKIALKPNITLINDAYNANPSSLKAGIDSIHSEFLTNDASEVWLILGDMKELGEQGKLLHKECGEYAKKRKFNKLFAIGDLAQESCIGFGDNAHHFSDHCSLSDAVLSSLLNEASTHKQTILFIKGSFSMGMEKIVEQLTKALT